MGLMTTTVAPTFLTTKRGKVPAQAISTIVAAELAGSVTDLAKAMRCAPTVKGWEGVFVAPNPDLADATGLALVASFYGQTRKAQRWTFQIRDQAAGAWFTLGYNDVPAAKTWARLRFPIPAPWIRFLGPDGVQVRYYTDSARDSSDLDLLVLEVTRLVAEPPPPPPPPIDPPPPAEVTSGVRTVFKGSFSSTDPAQLAYVAEVADLRILSSGPTKIAAIHAENPGAIVYRYQKIGGLHGPATVPPSGDPGFAEAQAAGLLWLGPSGRPVTQTQNGWYFFDIIDPAKRAAWLPILLANCSAQLALGYDAIFFDNACVIDPSLISERPASYTDVAYYSAVADLLGKVRAALPGVPILVNSYMGGAAPGTRGLELLENCDGLMFEGFSMKASGKFFTDRARYVQQLSDFATVCARGKLAVAMDYAPAADAQRRMWSLASYLVVNSPRAFHYYAATDSATELQQYPEDELPVIGQALGPSLERPDGLIVRAYTGATVVVNPGTVTVTYPLGAGSWARMVLSGGGAFPNPGTISWTPVSGAAVTLGAGTAAIVRSA